MKLGEKARPLLEHNVKCSMTWKGQREGLRTNGRESTWGMIKKQTNTHTQVYLERIVLTK